MIESTKLADRLRGIVAPKGARTNPGSGFGPIVPTAAPVPKGNGLQVLGGDWCQLSSGRSFVVEHSVGAQETYGRVRVGDLAAVHVRAASHAPMLSAGAPSRPPFVFIDVETTGLSGGAGTFAFLVGCGWFDDGGAFLTRQHLLTSLSDERPMLDGVALELARAGAIVSFNGKSFDAPLLETRYLFHRLEWVGARLPHIDALHPSRRFWRDTPGHDDQVRGAAMWAAEAPCSLATLERQVLGARRIGDVAGFEIPSRYFQFVRTGDARPLAAVLEHNRLDLLSLAGLTARLLHLISEGPGEARDAREALALGRTYARAGLHSQSIDAYQHATTMTAAPGRARTAIQIETLRSLALAYRRLRRFDDAAARWRQLLETPGCPGAVAREATEALAIHHEHRVRDLAAARRFALESMDDEARPRWNDAVRHRLARLERKMTVEEEAGLFG